MDWYRVLATPSLLDKAWYKDVRAPPISQLETYRIMFASPLPDALPYECVNCSLPVFAQSRGKETSDGEFAVGVKEEFLIFMKSVGVVMCTDPVRFNGNVFYVVTCECGTELGYFVVELRPRYRQLYETFWARGERIRSRDTSHDTKMMDFVKEKVGLVLSKLEEDVSSGTPIPILTPEFMAVAGSAAVDVANRALGNDVEDSHFLALEPERRGT